LHTNSEKQEEFVKLVSGISFCLKEAACSTTYLVLNGYRWLPIASQ